MELIPEASLLAASLKWAHRDPFDRIITATAITKGLMPMSADAVFDADAARLGWSRSSLGIHQLGLDDDEVDF